MQPQLNVVLVRVALVMVSVHSSKTLRHSFKMDVASMAFEGKSSLTSSCSIRLNAVVIRNLGNPVAEMPDMATVCPWALLKAN